MYRPLVAFLAFILVSALQYSAEVPCNKQFQIAEVNLATNRVSASELAAVRARLIGKCFDDQQVEELAGIAKNALQNVGYLRAVVHEPSLTVNDASRHPQLVSLKFEVDAGARYKVREIEVLGSSALSLKQILAVSQIQLEDFVDDNKMQETADAVKRLYEVNGYPNVSVVPEVRFLSGFGVCVCFKIVERPESS